MTKHQMREIDLARHYVRVGMIDTAAAVVSACIRAATRKKDELELRVIAAELNLIYNENFVC